MLKKTPFHTEDGDICFNWQPTSDRLFLYPSSPPTTFGEGIIHIPDHLQEFYFEGIGIVLAVGPGFFNDKGIWQAPSPALKPGVLVYYDKDVPWKHPFRGPDNVLHQVVFCGALDILAVIEEE